MNIVTDFTAELEERCTHVANANFDASVEVRQIADGPVFRFTLVDEDGDTSSLTAHYVGAIKGHDIYSFCGSENAVEDGVHMAMIPSAIVGLLTL